jgi:hypothetical protein
MTAQTTETQETLYDIQEEGDDFNIVDTTKDEILATVYADEALANKIKRMIEKADSGNALMTLRPYKWGSMWVFDDAAVGLRKEPFVSGIPAILDDLLSENGIHDPDNGYYLTFSATPFPGFQRSMSWTEADKGGNWYECDNAAGVHKEGWLCPALFKYYDAAPKKLYAKVESRGEDDKIKPDESPNVFLSGLRKMISWIEPDPYDLPL